MTVEMIDYFLNKAELIGKLDLPSRDIAEIFGFCEMVFNNLCELYIQKIKP